MIAEIGAFALTLALALSLAQAALSECWLNRSAARALELLAKRRMLENP